jgi:anaphase-promoting complex subunit 2
VKELQVLLAQRLLAIKDGNFERVEKEVSSLLRPLVVELMLVPPNQRRNIEILKIRFGEAALQVCEVMLKDMTDSKRIDGHVQSQKAVCLFRSLVESWKLMW